MMFAELFDSLLISEVLEFISFRGSGGGGSSWYCAIQHHEQLIDKL